MDFLASFNFDADDSANPRSSSCASVEELQLRLSDVLAEKTTPTRAEHVAATLDIGATARFTLNLSTTENSVLEGLKHLDPSLGGLRATSVNTENPGEQTTHDISATDALMNQPQDDPVLQRAVARHIMAAVSAADGSTWIMREMSRDSQGWNFTYLCKDSTQQWDRQNKGKTKFIIGEYTQRDMDPTLKSRPAFDCRGTVRVSFAQGGRSIAISYDHTPLHQTVAEVAEYFRPPPRPTILQKPDKSEKQKSPKKPPSARKKRDSTKALDENGNPRKRKKKATEAQLEVGPAHEQQSLGQDTQNGQGSLELADDSAAGAAQALQEPHQPSAAASLPLNLSPEEAARRRDAATKLLVDAGVDPESLSIEQFNIFANQSPDLQRESLNMLAKYGAERLRIVHPSNRDSSAPVPPSSTATPVQTTHAAASGAMTTTELLPRAPGSEDETEGVAKEQKRRKMGKSRSACFQCKGRKVKCSRERPTCAECLATGMGCEYAPPRPRIKKSKSDVNVPADYDAEEDSHLDSAPLLEPPEDEAREYPQMALPVDQPMVEDIQEYESEGEAPQEATPHGEEAQHEQSDGEGVDEGDGTDYSTYPQIPVSDMLTPSSDVQNHTARPMHQSQQLPYFRSASGLALPQPEEPPVSLPMQTISSGLILPQGTVHFPSHMASTTADTPSLHQTADEALHLSVSPQQTQQAAKGPRRSLPTGPPQIQGRHHVPMAPTAVSGWPSSLHSGSQATGDPMSPPKPYASQPHKGAAGEPSSQGSDRRPPTVSPRMQDAIALSQAALEHHQKQTQSLPMTMQPSVQPNSFHPTDDLLTNSRQAQRAQTKTPKKAQSLGSAFQAPPPAEPTMTTMSNATSGSQYQPATHSMNNASSFSNYGRYSEALPNTSTSDRIGYEPYSYQRSNQSTATYPAYDYGRNTASTMSMDDSSVTSMASGYPANTLNLPDSLSAARGHNAPNRTGSPYNSKGTSANQGARRRPSLGPSPDFDLRTATQTTRPGQGGQGHGHGSVKNNQQQQQQQNQQRGQQQPQHPREQKQGQPGQGQQGQSWYNFNDPGNQSYSFGLHRSNYNWKMSDEPWGGGVS